MSGPADTAPRPMRPAPTVSRIGLPAGGRTVVMVADAHHREALARELKLTALTRFEARLRAERAPREGVRVSGRIAADLVQPCVVTLADVASRIDAPVDVTYSPHAAPDMRDGEIVVDPDLEGPEPMEGDVLDLAEIAREHLVLALDPYPRADGAELDPDLATDAEASPFAALQALRTPRE